MKTKIINLWGYLGQGVQWWDGLILQLIGRERQDGLYFTWPITVSCRMVVRKQITINIQEFQGQRVWGWFVFIIALLIWGGQGRLYFVWPKRTKMRQDILSLFLWDEQNRSHYPWWKMTSRLLWIQNHLSVYFLLDQGRWVDSHTHAIKQSIYKDHGVNDDEVV